jgi:hypothetical protein
VLLLLPMLVTVLLVVATLVPATTVELAPPAPPAGSPTTLFVPPISLPPHARTQQQANIQGRTYVMEDLEETAYTLAGHGMQFERSTRVRLMKRP